MYRMELFECSAATPIQLHLKAGSSIRVHSGRLWLTVEGQSEDIWLCGGEQWSAPRDLQVWLSAEPVASFGLLHPVLPVDAQSNAAHAFEPLLAYAGRIIRAVFRTTQAAH
jgi:hypothetical protein